LRFAGGEAIGERGAGGKGRNFCGWRREARAALWGSAVEAVFILTRSCGARWCRGLWLG
jgi:hypothetical protein